MGFLCQQSEQGHNSLMQNRDELQSYLGAPKGVWFSSSLEVFCSRQHVKTRVTFTVFNDPGLFVFLVSECISSFRVVT